MEHQKSFWKKRGLKLPGSWSNNNNNSSSTSSPTTEPIVIGAKYTYNSLVVTTSQQQNKTNSNQSVMLPSQYPTSSRHSVGTAQHVFKSNSKSNIDNPNASSHNKSKSGSIAHHKRDNSHKKSFNAFLKDTNDEWNDDIQELSIPKIPTAANGSVVGDTMASLSQPKLLSKENAKTMDRASKVAEAVLSATHNNNNLPVAPRKKKIALDIEEHVNELLLDPTFLLKWLDVDDTKDPARTLKFKQVLSDSNVDLVALRKLSWSGIPEELRMMAWQLLLGYLPCNSARRETALARKRKDYADSVTATYARGTAGLDQTLWHQIHIDIPRTNPGIPLYQYEATQLCLERILYQWAIRHPASGYVQGINDLVTPIFEVFLSAYINEDPEQYDVSQLDKQVLSVIEADSFWCLSKLLDGIQDNYTFAQPGIQRQILTLKELVSRIDARLAQHLSNEGIEFIQFAFRWMNCLLMRELPLRSTIRMWDTYLAEGSSEGFSEFHVYVCAAFLVKWSNQLQKLDFQGIMIFLQQLPTQGWQEKDVELLLSEAYMWKTLFHNAPNHLK